MIPKVHKKGRSFSGAANYLLHDKDRASSSDRVAWTSTRNLATTNPHAAWRVMAATAMDQGRLKRTAGVKSTGRKSVDSVLHMTLSWHPDEADGLSRDEMMRAALGAIRAIGAEDRQALFVSHDDEPQPHVHILVNRVSPTDGRMLPSSKEKLNLSRWAQDYEQERGEVLCEQRVINNAARDRDEYTRGEPDKPRHIYELEASNDNAPDANKTRAEQKQLDLALARKTRELWQRHTDQTADLVAKHRAKRSEIQDESKREELMARDRVRAAFRPRWEERFHEHQADLREFEKREEQLLGRVENALRSIDFGAIITSRDRRTAVIEAYNAISSSGGRLSAFKRAQIARDLALEREQKAMETKVITKVRLDAKRQLVEQRALFKAERVSLSLGHKLELAGNRTEWRTRGQQREAAFEKNRFHGKERGPAIQQDPSGRQEPRSSSDLRSLLEGFNARQQEQERKAREQDNNRDQDGRSR
ncbi:MAG: relaxase/mobilization nuclease domain-containing protein [Planctomycetota bacterium]